MTNDAPRVQERRDPALSRLRLLLLALPDATARSTSPRTSLYIRPACASPSRLVPESPRATAGSTVSGPVVHQSKCRLLRGQPSEFRQHWAHLPAQPSVPEKWESGSEQCCLLL